MEEAFAISRRRSLLEHFGTIKDARQPCKIMYSLPEVVLLVVCATVASCDDYDEIVAWGEAHLGFLRRFLPFHWGIPCEDWLRVVMNRLDPELFSACFSAWASELRPQAIDLVAIDGKTSRRSHDRSKGKKALHLVSAWATNERLVLGQEAVEEKSNEITAIPALLERLAIKGALVTIDAIDCNASAPCSTSSPQMNAPTISRPQATEIQCENALISRAGPFGQEAYYHAPRLIGDAADTHAVDIWLTSLSVPSGHRTRPNP